MAEYTKVKTARTVICELCNELYPDDPCEPADCDWLRMLEEDALSCDNCKWLGKRYQKCSCCLRNRGENAMTHKDFSTIQRMLGFIEGAIFDHDKSVNCGILDAIEVIDAILEKEVRTDGGDDNG